MGIQRTTLLMVVSVLVCLSATGADAALPAPSDTLVHVALMQGKWAGEPRAWVGPDGALHVHFEFNDRGRGPSLDSRIVLGEGGVPTLIETTGNNYLKTPVDEWFRWEGGRAAWSNAGEQDERPLSSPAFYVSMDGPPEGAALLARALLAAPDSSLPLLPEGSARIEFVRALELEGSGASETVRGYAITGLGFTPSPIWLDGDGRLFAQVSGWFAVIREGWEESADVLQAAQEEWAAERTRAMARRLAKRPDTSVAITGVTLFDSETGRVRPRTTVVVSGDRIAAVGADGEVEVPADAQRIDGTGKTLLPGLWDMHVHLSDVDGPLNIAAGVTTVRDLANEIDQLLDLRRRFDEGLAIGPRVIMAGFMDGPGPYAGPTKILVDTEEEVVEAIERYAELGYEQIKVYSSIKTELVPVIVERAQARGLPVSGHIPAFMTAEDAVRQGFDEIQHVNMLFLNFLGDSLDTRTPLRFTEVAKHGADLDFESDSVREFIRLLKNRGVIVDPTVAIFESMFTARPGMMGEGNARIADRLPPQVRRGYLSGGLPAPEGMDERYRASFRSMLTFVRVLYEAGVPIVAGTDALAGFTLHRELELYVEAGIPAPDVLQLATWRAARITGRADVLGSVAPGKLADLILVDGDPLLDIRNIRRVELVLKGGVLYDPAAIYRELGVRPWQEVGE